MMFFTSEIRVECKQMGADKIACEPSAAAELNYFLCVWASVLLDKDVHGGIYTATDGNLRHLKTHLAAGEGRQQRKFVAISEMTDPEHLPFRLAKTST
jgi:hypothetical protein